MKTTKILYWVFTVLLIGLMLMSAIGTFMGGPQAEAFAKQIELPVALFKFLAVAKILGVIAILVPGYPRIKEWAYAGFAFDMIGAIFLFMTAKNNFPAAGWAPMLVGGLVFLFGSYFCYHRLKGN